VSFISVLTTNHLLVTPTRLLADAATAGTDELAAYCDASCCTLSSAKKYTAELKGWEQAKRPTPLCLGMYEPVVTLMTMNVVMAALQTDDSSHQHWMNQVRTCDCLTITACLWHCVIELLTTHQCKQTAIASYKTTEATVNSCKTSSNSSRTLTAVPLTIQSLILAHVQ
jgi:hypothetical protein